MQNREYLRGMCLSVIKDVHVSVTKYLMNTTKVLADLVLFREYHKLTKDDRETNMEKFKSMFIRYVNKRRICSFKCILFLIYLISLIIGNKWTTIILKSKNKKQRNNLQIVSIQSRESAVVSLYTVLE